MILGKDGVTVEEALRAIDRAQADLTKSTVDYQAQIRESMRTWTAETDQEASDNRYKHQLEALESAYNVQGVDGALKAFSEMSDSIQRGITELYPQIVSSMLAWGEDSTALAAQSLTDYRRRLGEQMQAEFGRGNVDLTKRPQVPDSALAAAGQMRPGEADGSTATVYSSYYAAGRRDDDFKKQMGFDKDFEDELEMIIHVTPILPDGQVLSPDAVYDYLRQAIASGDVLDFDAKGKGIVLAVDEVTGDWQQAFDAADEFDERLHEAQAQYYGMQADEAQGFLETVRAAMAVAEDTIGKLDAKTLAQNAEQYQSGKRVDEASGANWQEQMEALQQALSGDNPAQAFMDVLTGLDAQMTEAMIRENEWINDIISGFAAAEESTMTLDEAQRLLNEHVLGTQENFLANVEAMTEANQGLLESEQQQIEALQALSDALAEGGLDAFREAFSALSEEMQKALFDQSPALRDFFEGVSDGSADSGKALASLRKETDKLTFKKLAKEGKVWDELADAMEDAGKDGKKFTKTFAQVVNKAEDLNEAMGALEYVQSDGAKKADDLADAYGVLASYTGLSAETLMGNLDPAIWAISGDMQTAANSAGYLANWLWNVAGVQFSAANWQGQLAALAGSADSTVAAVARLVQTLLQCAGASLSLNGDAIQVNWGSGSYTPPSASRGGGGGGGGGGRGGGGGSGSGAKVSKTLNKLLNQMEENLDIKNHQREMAQLAQEYYEVRGEIQGVIKYLLKEQDVVADSNKDLESYLDTLERQIAKKEAEMLKYKAGSKKYKQAKADLEALKQTHSEYSQQLLQNEIDLEKLTQALEAQKNAIRDMEIDLRETIHQAILDREELNERMLQGEIDLQNEVLAVITARYEKERDQQLDNAQAKRDALEEEMRLLDEQLAKRKKLADQEDKQAKLAELEAQMLRVSADPTRKKEELQLREQIAKLREEMAWDAAQAEVDAQKESIEQQITSIDEYMEYVERYYEELLANPRKLIEQMRDLLTATDEEILEWLKQNSEDYQTSTDEMREDMANGWRTMLDDMRGATDTYWDEVEEIIARGEDAILEFLRKNSADYREAGKLQAEAYYDEWKKKLDDLRKAYKQVQGEFNDTHYTPPSNNNGGGSGGGGSGGGGSGGGGSGGGVRTYTYGYRNSKGTWVKATSSTSQSKAFQNALSAAKSHWQQFTGQYGVGEVFKALNSATLNNPGTYIKKYLLGGLATGTGLAWLDGTRQRPERILSPYQTELFEDLIQSLHEIKSFRVPSSVVTPCLPDAQQDRSTTIENITVNVERLETEQDYDQMAEKVGEKIMEKVTRGMSVGGIRLG